MGLPLHSRLRRTIKNGFDALLRFLFPSRAIREPIPAGSIRRILVIRINYRIGNILFTTPLLKALELRFPEARIDVLIGASYPAPLLMGFRGIENVYDFPRELLKHPLKLWRYIRRIRSTRYDLVVNLNPGSASDRGATFLARGEYKLGFDTPSNWSPLTHVVPSPPGETHEALKPLYLMEAFGNRPGEYPQWMDISLSDEERENGAQELMARLSQQGTAWEKGKRIIGMFRDARFEKKIDNSWWQSWYREMKRLNPDALFVDILSPDVPEKLDPSLYSIGESNLRRLGGILSQMDLFVCGDTGPMHLASASKVPTAALFKASTPVLYGTLGPNDLSLTLASSTPEEIAATLSAHLDSIGKK